MIGLVRRGEARARIAAVADVDDPYILHASFIASPMLTSCRAASTFICR